MKKMRKLPSLRNSFAYMIAYYNSGRDRRQEEVTFAEECTLKSLAFRGERCFYLAESYSLAGKRAEAYVLYCHARSLAEDAIQKLRSSNKMLEELKTLVEECRANSCIEHATGILEEVKALENLTKKISNISLAGTENKSVKFLLQSLDNYESTMGDSNVKSAPRIEAFPPAFQAIPLQSHCSGPCF